MSSVIISGDTSGAVTIAAPAVAGTNTLTLQAGTATNSMNTLATAVASTSGTSIDFTSLPAWVKRITVMLSGVSVSGTSNMQIQIGAGSIQTTSYNATVAQGDNANSVTSMLVSSGFLVTQTNAASYLWDGNLTITTLGNNTWTGNGSLSRRTVNSIHWFAGGVTLSGTLDRVRLTTVNGTDTFDAGSVNILYEG